MFQMLCGRPGVFFILVDVIGRYFFVFLAPQWHYSAPGLSFLSLGKLFLALVS